MKKLILVVLLIVIAAGGYAAVSRYARLGLDIFKGETAFVKRGDLVVPITASGNIKPANVTQIKGKASGEVIEIPVELGDMVKKGQLLIKLLDIDEKRSVEQADASFQQAQIALRVANITVDQRLPTAVQKAEANLKQAKAQLSQITSRYDFLYSQRPGEPNSTVPQVEWDSILYSKATSEAAVMVAEADVKDAQTAIDLAKEDVKKASEVVKATQAALSDAQERLRETTILSPLDGMVLDKMVKIGEIVQSGKTMFTGGTVLMEIADVTDIYAIVNVDEADIGQVRDLAKDLPSQSFTTQPSASSAPADVADTAGDGAESNPAGKQLATLPAGTFDEAQPVKVTVETFPDEEFKGMITRIAPQSEVVQAVATFKVWIKITSPNGIKLKKLLNTQAEAHFTANSVRNALLVSYDAVQKNPRGEDYGVYTPEVDPTTMQTTQKFVPCKFGADNGIDIEVRSGLKDGDKVYTKLPLKSKQQQEEEDKKNSG